MGTNIQRINSRIRRGQKITPKEVKLHDAATRAAVVHDGIEKAKGGAPVAAPAPPPVPNFANRVIADELRAEKLAFDQCADALILAIERGENLHQPLAAMRLAASSFDDTVQSIRTMLRLGSRESRLREAMNATLPAGNGAPADPAKGH